jgi:hypothetical protein
MLVLFTLLAVMCSRVSGLGTAMFTVAAIITLFFTETHLDFQRGQVIRVARLLGFLTVWHRDQAMSGFAGIQCDNATSGVWETWRVSLKSSTGRAIVVRTFMGSIREGRAAADAQEFAQELSKLTGLGVVDHAA